jgi:Holliday junction DNA helicase RuvA
MIGRLSGSPIADDPPFLTVDVNGVGYEVAVPLGAVGRATKESGQVELWVHTVMRSDALELFGFPSELERRVFRQLIAVPNVGPRTALGVLSALPVAELVRAVEARDLAALTRVPGIGKKTAERLVLELHGKLAATGELSVPATGPSPANARPSDAKSRLIAALTNMGYRPAEAERAVQSLGPRVGSEPLSDLLREALAQLST